MNFQPFTIYPAKFNMEPKNDGFQLGISYSRVLFSGSMLNFRRVHCSILKDLISNLPFVQRDPWAFVSSLPLIPSSLDSMHPRAGGHKGSPESPVKWNFSQSDGTPRKINIEPENAWLFSSSKFSMHFQVLCQSSVMYKSNTT